MERLKQRRENRKNKQEDEKGVKKVEELVEPGKCDPQFEKLMRIKKDTIDLPVEKVRVLPFEN